MEALSRIESRARLLALGNDLLGDDEFGLIVAREARRRLGNDADIVVNTAGGFDLLDDVLGVGRLVVVDTVQTGHGTPGAIHVWGEEDLHSAPAVSPHGASLLDVLAAARAIGLGAPTRVTFIAVEAADCSTIGGRLHPAVDQAVRVVTDQVVDLLQTGLERARYA